MITREASQKALEKNSGWIIAYGVVLVLIGIAAIFAPFVTGVATAMLVGALLLASGVVQLIHAFRAGTWGSGLAVFFGGFLRLVFGGLVLAHPLLGLSFLTILLVIYFMVDGVSRCAFAWRLRPLHGWSWSMFGGLACILLAALLWFSWPLSGAWAVGTLVGINILLIGWAALEMGAAARSEAHRHGPTPHTLHPAI